MTHSIAPLPDAVKKKIEAAARTEKDRRSEIAAYYSIMTMIEEAKDPFTKRVHTQTLEYLIDSEMKFSYAIENVMPDALRAQEWARRALQPFELYAEIERILSGGTRTETFGEAHRYPLVTSAECSFSVQLPRRTPIREDTVLPANFLGASYHFGAHRFPVGRHVADILHFVEKRYGIDFRQLERERVNRAKK